jgi:hypothetical protein
MANNQRAQTMLKKIAAIAIGASIGLAIVPLCGVAQAGDSRPPVKNVAKYSNAVLTLTQNSRNGTANPHISKMWGASGLRI